MSFITASTNMTLSGNGESGSYVGCKLEKVSEPSLDVKVHQTKGFHFIFEEYIKGDEDGIYLDFYWSDQDLVNNTKIAILESDSVGVLSALRRTLSVSLTEPSSFSVPVPACAEYICVKVTKNGGTPTGTIVISGDYDSFKERG